VYRITDDIAIVLTADFFTPISDDPYWFGAIAASNALSDVYAMGAKPVAALNIAMFPNQEEFFPSLKKIMQGGVDKMAEAGVSIIGGHTIRDKEPKFGFAVLGLIHPEKIFDNTKAKPGDALILTKKIGTGIVASGIRAGMCDKATIEEFTQSMATLNKRASEIMLEIGVSTATDVTGFGLIGHLYEVLSASKCSAHVHSNKVPVFPDVLRLIDEKKVPGGTIANCKSYDPYVKWREDITDSERFLLNDAQTSGGLLIFVPGDKKEKLITALQNENILAAYIGDVPLGEIEDNKRIFVD
jgi:selenide,water dikinase